jgi:hypothetical protein
MDKIITLGVATVTTREKIIVVVVVITDLTDVVTPVCIALKIKKVADKRKSYY